MTRTARVAVAVGMTEGQVYTVATSMVVALLLLGLGLPSLRDVAPQLPAASAGPSPLELPGSPAVADAIGSGEVAALPPAVPSPAAGAEPLPSADAGGTQGPGADPAPTPSTSPETVRPPRADGAPLEVVHGRYASGSGPLLLAGAPGEHLPVGLRLGAPDKQSYLRLRGAGTVLRLRLSTEPGHQLANPGEVRACAIVTADWELDDGSSLAEAPEVDGEDCVDGEPGPSRWTFDLSSVDTANGVALVPAGDATGSFQVTFLGQAG
jgi:hypothetical protein